jgi:hypothetical protein
MSSTISLGKEIETGRIRHISEVNNGLNCKCICSERDCDIRLIAVNNKNNKRDHHFRHETETDCKGGIETALHLLSKQIISESDYIQFPDETNFSYDSSFEEVLLEKYRPDIIIENLNEEKKWLIEVAVTSFVKEDKLEKIKKDNYNCLEIDLSKVDRGILPLKLKSILLDNISNKTVLNRVSKDELIEDSTSESNITDYLIYGIVAMFTYFGLKKMFKKYKYKKKHRN